MSTTFHIRHVADRTYAASFTANSANCKPRTVVSIMRTPTWRITVLTTLAKSRLQTRVAALAVKDPSWRAHSLQLNLQWDEDVSDLQDSFKSQMGIKGTVVSSEPREYYLDGATVKRLSEPLLTWQEACDLLKIKVA